MPETPDATGKDSREEDQSIRLEKVLHMEQEQINAVRGLRGVPEDPKDSGKFPLGKVRAASKHEPPRKKPEWQGPDRRWAEWLKVVGSAHKMNLVGLSFSGGGIRSATFNLGVLQALADLNLLYRIDYLSTVSGGGYIGGWLAAWINRKGSFREVQQLLSADRVDLEDDIESMPIRFLRTYSNYLTPRLGLFSGDTLAMVAIYLRNLLLNQSVIVGLLATLLLLPRVIHMSVEYLFSKPGIGNWMEGFELCLLIVATCYVAVNMERLSQGLSKAEAKRTKQHYVLWLVIVPFGIASVAAGLWLHVAELPLVWGRKVPYWAFGAGGYTVLWLLGLGIIKVRTQCRTEVRTSKKAGGGFERWFKRVGGALVTGAMAGWLYGTLAGHADWWCAKSALTFGVPLVVAIAFLAATLHIGLQGSDFRDERREWWGRLSGLMLALGAGWVALFWVVLYFPEFFQPGQNTLLRQTIRNLATEYLTPAWILTTIGSVLAGNSQASGKPGEKTATQTFLDLLAKVGPYVFIVGLVCWISWGLSRAPFNEWWKVCLAAAVCAEVTALMSWRVDINQFSMHMFYRNRLVGCYLGATNQARRPNLFTGIDPNDDLPLMDFQVPAGASKGHAGGNSKPYDGPYPIFNMSMNLVKGKDLAWQERKAESFVMTPHFCGYDVFLEQHYGKMQSDEFKEAYKKKWQKHKKHHVLLQQRDLKMQSGDFKEAFKKEWEKDNPYETFLERHYSNLRSRESEEAYKRTLEETYKRKVERHKKHLEEHKKEWKNYKKRINDLDLFGYRATEEYAFPLNDQPGYHGPNLGLAMAISGAAASPNMGYYTTTAVAFLLTAFNVRLGQWLGNPRNRVTSRMPTPTFGLGCLIQELFAGTNDESDYVYLSDGGHFDNMGLYELVKRRCGLIIVCDAEADPHYGFAGLSDAIKKCRIDLGIAIDIDTSPIVPNKSGVSKQHYAIGRIHYEKADVEAPVGKIVYIKSSLTGKEPADVATYKKRHSAFPHEDTANQWFTESQFESYRRLGYEAVYSTVFPRQTPGGAAAKSRLLNSELLPICNQFRFQIPDPNNPPNHRLKNSGGI